MGGRGLSYPRQLKVFEIVAGVEEDEGEIEPSSIVSRPAVSVQSLQEKLGTQVLQVRTVLTGG